jgi:hypothetical protein
VVVVGKDDKEAAGAGGDGGEAVSHANTHNIEATRAQLALVGVCHSLRTETPPRKRMKTNGFGREEAVVLNSGEHLAAARARLHLR